VVGSNDVEAVGEQRDQVAEHERARRVPVEEHEGRGGRVARLAVEDLVPVDGALTVVDLVHV